MARNRVVEGPLANTKVPRYQLFNLASDPSEQNDLFTDEPDVAPRLIAQLEAAIAAGRTRP